MPFTSNGPNMPTVCAVCGCDEEEHGSTDVDENGDVVEICGGCGEECYFEPAEEKEEEE
jgi:hypothetical protein